MVIEQLHIRHYKNYSESSFDFSPEINALVGPNGVGKTNLLDAIYYLCLTKSHFSGSDRKVIRHGDDFFRLQARFRQGKKHFDLEVKVEPGRRKEFILNGKVYERLSDHIGKFPAVLLAPDDIFKMLETSRERRKLIDNTLSQLEPEYLQQLVEYNRLLKQRNTLLKNQGNRATDELLETYDRQMEGPANYIHARREQFIDKIIPHFSANYIGISGAEENAGLRYSSKLNNRAFNELMRASRKMDRINQRTNEGIHKDDLVVLLDGKALKHFGSQGQWKSFFLSLKLAQYRILEESLPAKPILLFDDIFAKLDDQRVRQLLEMLSGEKTGQVFLSDTSDLRTREVLSAIPREGRIFVMEKQAKVGNEEE